MSRTSDKEILKNAVIKSGNSIGNTALMNELNWQSDPAKFWRVRNELIEDGILIRGRGKGGSVKLVHSTDTETVRPIIPVAGGRIEQYDTERKLQKPFAKVIGESFVADRELKEAVVQDVSHQGSRDTGGRYTRPDLVLCTIRTYTYVPGKFLDIYSFELKRERVTSN
jgi:hypothetical protein